MFLAKVNALGNARPDMFAAQMTIARFQDLPVLRPVHRKIALILGHKAAFPARRRPIARRSDVGNGAVVEFEPVATHYDSPACLCQNIEHWS